MTIAEAKPAATVVLVRENDGALEVLLLLRSRKLGFHGGEWVFPGGRVDESDATDGDLFSESSARRAAAREAKEEAGADLASESFVVVSHWTTPVILPKRFATYFFLAVAPEGDVSVDGSEIEAHRWMRPADALRARDAGEIGLPPPTFVTLTELAELAELVDLPERSSLDATLEAFRSREVPWLMPHVAVVDGYGINLLPGDAGYETTRHDLDGPRHRVVMDPSGWRYERPSL